MTRPAWDFDYRPSRTAYSVTPAPQAEFVLATPGDVDAADLAAALGKAVEQLQVVPLLSSHPLYWTRLRLGAPTSAAALATRLRTRGLEVRYVTPAATGSQSLPDPPNFRGARPRLPTHWPARPVSVAARRLRDDHWFTGPSGICLVASCCGTGAGQRLAVIDHDAGALDELDLDAEVLVAGAHPARGSRHAAQLVAWATRTRVPSTDGAGEPFLGVAPDASTRVYLIPRPGLDVVSLPLAIVQAIDDGADVVLCATHVEGHGSPLLDDALELARRLGRGGRGTPVVMPCGRDTASPEGSAQASLSVDLGDPAGDPRILCVGPSGRDGGWFLWRDRRQRWHPFGNRTPAQRWLAPGDDLPDPFAPGRHAHAESSGAAALAAGVLLLVLGCSPILTAEDAASLLTATATRIVEERSQTLQLGNPQDLLPQHADADGHDAKLGYGRLNAARACAAARDPLAGALTFIGEDTAARHYLELLLERPGWRRLYSAALGGWLAREVVRSPTARHAACVLARSLRLFREDPRRLSAHAPGSPWRQIGLLLRLFMQTAESDPDAGTLQSELAALYMRTQSGPTSSLGATGDADFIIALAEPLWPRDVSQSALEESSHLPRRLQA